MSKDTELLSLLEKVLFTLGKMEYKLGQISTSLDSISRNVTVTPRPYEFSEETPTLGDEISSELRRIASDVRGNATHAQLDKVIELLGLMQPEGGIVSTEQMILDKLAEIEEALRQIAWK